VFLAPTTSDSHALAEAFGVGAFEMEKHHLDAQKVSIEKLRDLCCEQEIEDFLNLREHGFEFYYLPNG
jgi:hypothetical protein